MCMDENSRGGMMATKGKAWGTGAIGVARRMSRIHAPPFGGWQQSLDHPGIRIEEVGRVVVR
jgi:hypothetical protein